MLVGDFVVDHAACTEVVELVNHGDGSLVAFGDFLDLLDAKGAVGGGFDLPLLTIPMPVQDRRVGVVIGRNDRDPQVFAIGLNLDDDVAQAVAREMNR